MKAPALYLKKREERRILSGHPWVFSNEVDVARSPLSNFEAGEPVEAPLTEALCTEDLKVVYPVEDSIPVLLQEKGIGTTQLASF